MSVVVGGGVDSSDKSERGERRAPLCGLRGSLCKNLTIPAYNYNVLILVKSHFVSHERENYFRSKSIF